MQRTRTVGGVAEGTLCTYREIGESCARIMKGVPKGSAEG